MSEKVVTDNSKVNYNLIEENKKLTKQRDYLLDVLGKIQEMVDVKECDDCEIVFSNIYQEAEQAIESSKIIMRKTELGTLCKALEILAEDIQSEDGVANACIHEAHERLLDQDLDIKKLTKQRDELLDALKEILPCYRLALLSTNAEIAALAKDMLNKADEAIKQCGES
jgi:Fe2+ or Zn2+ uptake regulation protein